MPLSCDIKLNIKQIPKFPNKCICCTGTMGLVDMEYSTNAIGWWTIVLTTFGKNHYRKVPVCEKCYDKVRGQKWRRMIILIICVAIGVSGAILAMNGYHGAFKYHILVGVAFVFMLPYFIWSLYHPPYFDMTATSTSIDYEFANREYAMEFTLMNDYEE